MGGYLSVPVRDKDSENGAGDRLHYGASSMQGWKRVQENAHSCHLELNPDQNLSMFAVFEGHGGPDVARYAVQQFPTHLRAVMLNSSTEGDELLLSAVLTKAFLSFDLSLLSDEVVARLLELRKLEATTHRPELGGGGGQGEEDEDDEAEAAMLVEEAFMPIEEVMRRYESKPTEDSSSIPNDANPRNGASESSDRVDVCDQSDAATASQSNASTSGGANECKRVIDASANQCSSSSDRDEANEQSSRSPSTAQLGETRSSDMGDLSTGQFCVQLNNCSQSTTACHRSGASSAVCGNVSCSDAELNNGAGVHEAGAGSSGVAQAVEASGGRSVRDIRQICRESSVRASETDPKRESVAGGRGSSSEGEDSEDSESGGDVWKPDNDATRGSSGSDDEGDDDDDDLSGDTSDDDLGGGKPSYTAMQKSVMPGVDTGCSALVALISGTQLCVASAGMSHCVLCRAGRAVDVAACQATPDDTEEGNLTGGRMPSKAFGLHSLKVTEQGQALSPDLFSATLSEEDEFLVLVSDGIWRVLGSQDIVNFVRERVQQGVRDLSSVCEEMFDVCLAPTLRSKVGCDNMTCVIVAFIPSSSHLSLALPWREISLSAKRSNSDTEDMSDVENERKRLRVTDNGVSSSS